MRKNNFLIFAIVFLLVAANISSAYVANSTNYRLESDALNFGGGTSNSNNYSIQGFVGDKLEGRVYSTNYEINSGPLPLNESQMSVSSVGALTLSGKVSSLTGGVANGSVSVTVITDNPGGYQLKVSGTTLSSGGNSFGVFAGPAAWWVSEGASAFGFSTSTDWWQGIDSTPRVAYKHFSNNQPTGTATTINFRAESKKKNQQQPAGNYSSNITLTALPL